MITYRKLGYVGRLGNQLFQVASTIGIAVSRNEDVVFPADWIYRPYFSLPDYMFSDSIPDSAEEATSFVSYMDPRCRVYLQDVSLFWSVIDDIRVLFNPSNLAREQVSFPSFEWSYSTAVHVRRGDNVVDPGVPNKSDYYICPDADYYMRGIDLFKPVTSSLSIYSDDIPWCKENLPPAAFYGNGVPQPKEHLPEHFTTTPVDVLDLFSMALNSQFVITGSTFSIWGAILGEVDPEHIVRPDRVYGPLLDYINSDLLFHPEWRVISAT